MGRAGATFRLVAAYCWHPRVVAGVPWLSLFIHILYLLHNVLPGTSRKKIIFWPTIFTCLSPNIYFLLLSSQFSCMKVFLSPFFRVEVPRCSGSVGLGGLALYAVVSLDSVVGRPAACSWSSGRLEESPEFGGIFACCVLLSSELQLISFCWPFSPTHSHICSSSSALYWCYYPHTSRDSVLPVCGIFFFFHNIS